MKFIYFLVTFLFFIGCVSIQISRAPQSTQSIYCGCLVFVDDISRSNELNYALEFNPDFILRSWYRWGEPNSSKSYNLRKPIVEMAISNGIGIGGGVSLSVVNDLDFSQSDFDASWLSKNLDDTIFMRKGRKFGSLSAPGFRNYLIKKLIEQAQVGVKEIHLGESNGEIHFDDWTLGLKGNFGFIQWLRSKYRDKSQTWWKGKFETLGEALSENKPINREMFLNLKGIALENFKDEWGKEGSWKGLNRLDDKSFLTDLYKNNLQQFLIELRQKLSNNGYKNIAIDVWGFADWMSMMTEQPDAYLSTPPDERWNLKWAIEPNFDLIKNRDRIKTLMENQIRSVQPIPVIYMIDHPKPFDDFNKLSDARQAEIIKFFSDLTKELRANFVLRLYDNKYKVAGTQVSQTVKLECQQRKKTFCPMNR